MTEPMETVPDPQVALPPGRGPARSEGDVVRARTVPSPGARRPGTPGVSENGRPSDPDELRLEIQRTRQRMSMTLDAIEDRVVRQKQELWAKATFQRLRRRLAREPWRSMAIAFVAGYVVAAIRD